MTAPGSVTRWVRQLGSDDVATREDAARQIWERYCHGLLELARRKLPPGVHQREDEHDVLQSMYKSFCLRYQRGSFDLGSRDDLWQVLVTITLRKVRNVVKRHGRERRDYRREQTEVEESSSLLWAFEQMEAAGPTPEEAVALSEEFQRRLQQLPQGLRQLALWKLEGYTNEEIAGPQMLDCSPRTVERKLERIRHLWEKQAEKEVPGDAST